METKNYRNANCDLFRPPSLIYSDLEKQISQMIIQKWEGGVSADKAFYDILKNPDILSSLSSQVQEQLEFQRAYGLRSLQIDQKARLEEIARNKEATIGNIESSLGQEAVLKNQQVQEADQRYKTATTTYNAIQARLDEMKARISDRLGKLGGEEGLGLLMQIDESISSQGASYKEPGAADQNMDNYTMAEREALKTGANKPKDAKKDGQKKENKFFSFFKKLLSNLNMEDKNGKTD